MRISSLAHLKDNIQAQLIQLENVTQLHPDLSRRRGRGLLSRASLHRIAGGALTNGVDSCHPKVIVGVRAEAAHTVARCGYAINLFVGVL